MPCDWIWQRRIGIGRAAGRTRGSLGGAMVRVEGRLGLFRVWRPELRVFRVLPKGGHGGLFDVDLRLEVGGALFAERVEQMLVALGTQVFGERVVLALGACGDVARALLHLPEPVAEVERVEQRFAAQRGARAVLGAIRQVAEGLDVDKSKEEHPKALKERIDARLDLLGGEVLGLLDGTKADEEREQRVLPEGEEDDGLDREELEDWFVGVDELADGHVELDEAIHGHTDRDADKEGAPNMSEPRHPAVEAIVAKVLCADGDKGAEGPDDGVLKHPDLHEPEEVEAVRAVLPRAKRPDPEAVAEIDVAEYGVLLCARVAGVGEDEVEEGSDEHGLVAVADGLVVERLVVEEVGHEGDDGVDGHHDEEAHDVALLLRTGVVGEVLPDEPGGGDGGDEHHDAAHEPADVVRLEVDLSILEERLGIGRLVRDGGACHVDHDGRSPSG
ncbi:hypothetical protein L1887_55174 [Cichorium endivia]|nr:hypothetical protein L1887_55174 [Cichorium endivia]